jgi:hypothetical protein
MYIYRPLALVVPKPVMHQYTKICGLSDLEAFFIVEWLRADVSAGSRDD